MSDSDLPVVDRFPALREWAAAYAEVGGMDQHRRAQAMALFKENEQLRAILVEYVEGVEGCNLGPVCECPSHDDLTAMQARDALHFDEKGAHDGR